VGEILPVRHDAPPVIEDATFSTEAGSLNVNVPRLYCETIGAPVDEYVMSYCLDRQGWRREQLIELARRLQDLVNPPDGGGTLAQIERRCRAEARAMLEDDDITAWTPMDAERAVEIVS
jgi:hypothetical protein